MNLTQNITAKEMGVDGFNTSSLPFQMALLVADNLQAIRDFYGKPVTVNCGYRDEGHNTSIGGVATSQHVYAEAADFTVQGVALEQVFNDIKNGVIKLPHKISQVILEESKREKGKWGWIHLAVFTNRWANSRAERGRKHEGNEILLCVSGNYHHAIHDAQDSVTV